MPTKIAPDPNSLDVLKKLLMPNADTFSANTPLALASARNSQMDETGDRVNSLRGAVGLGSPSTQRMTAAELQRQLGMKSDLEHEQAADPFTGDEPQKEDLARTQAVNSARISASPEVAAQTDAEQRRKLALAGEPNRVSGENALAVEKQKQEPLNRFMDQQQSGGTEAPPMSFRPTVSENGITFTGVEEPQQVRNQQHAATVGLGGIQALRNIVQTLDKHGSIGPVAGRFGEAATSTGLDSYLMHPEAAQAFNDFKAQSSLVKSNMAMAHGGSRGGSSPALTARFDALINPHQTAASVKGGLDAFERWLTAYANAKNSADLDAADEALGVGNGPVASQDPYANPNYPPK